MEYIKELKKFKFVNGEESDLPIQFNDLASYFLKKGYFLVNGHRKVYICDVEFYYHEENKENANRIKDYSMYHRDGRNEQNPAYFPLGQFNAHTSGIDITFENEEHKYRAAMLIRGFKADGMEVPEGKLYDERSTYFYEALLNCKMQGNQFTIEWVEWKDDEKSPFNECEIKQTYRKNIVEYYIDGEHEGEKKEGKPTDYDREWRFHFKKF